MAERILALTDLTMNLGGKRVLNGINLDVYQGQIIGYIGPNGAGKSTTVKIMLGLMEDYQGTVEILGKTSQPVTIHISEKLAMCPRTRKYMITSQQTNI